MMREFIPSFLVGMAVALLYMLFLPKADATECIPRRDANGRIARSATQVHHFKIQNPCPATGYFSTHCPGYVVDHIVPLCACGVDRPENMQWQSVAEAKEKDRFERAQCKGSGDGD
jgi:hypothetical protein